MAGFTTNEGLAYIGGLIYTGDTRQDLTLGLFTNSSLDETSVWADVTQPSGSGYAEVSLSTGSFGVSADGTVTYPQQTWIAGADWSPGTVYGYYIRNDAGTPALVHVEFRAEGAFEMTNGKVYAVDLSVDTS